MSTPEKIISELSDKLSEAEKERLIKSVGDGEMYKEKFAQRIGYITIVMSFSMLAMLSFWEVPEANRDIVSSAFFLLFGTLLGTVFSKFFGSENLNNSKSIK
jgi:hypothetical protein